MRVEESAASAALMRPQPTCRFPCHSSPPCAKRKRGGEVGRSFRMGREVEASFEGFEDTHQR
jgi:hypothetical protein